jgi:aerobic carbon-monoxide dehydrogenase medium subunit
MKARSFRYVRPASLKEALQVLADAAGDAVPVAGGQSLLAGLNMRLSAPKLLVDISRLEELTGQSYADGIVRIGALTCHRELLQSDLVRKHLALLTQAVPHIGHVAIRNRGTLGGSLAYADPAAELPACAVALDATLVLHSLLDERQVKAEDFFKGLFETDLRPGELIVAVNFPVSPLGTRCGFAELSRRHGDFAMVGAAAIATMTGDRIDRARLAYFGCVSHAMVARAVSAAVAGRVVPIFEDPALDEAIQQDVTPDDTPGLRADTRIHMAKVLTRRVLNRMSERAAA